MKIQLTKLASNHYNLRTDIVVGTLASPPAIGEPLVIYADPLDVSNYIRRITTSPVTGIIDNFNSSGIVCFTANSVYDIKYLDEADKK